MEKFVIAWQNKDTLHTGEGTAQFDYRTAQQICDEANIEYPFLNHWPKPAGISDNPTEPFTPVEDPDTIIFRGEGD